MCMYVYNVYMYIMYMYNAIQNVLIIFKKIRKQQEENYIKKKLNLYL